MPRRELDYIDKEIMRVLIREAIPLTVREISDKTGVSWITVKTRVENLKKLQLVEEVDTKTRKWPKWAWNFSTMSFVDATAAQ